VPVTQVKINASHDEQRYGYIYFVTGLLMITV
jgi:hypothetical protein